MVEPTFRDSPFERGQWSGEARVVGDADPASDLSLEDIEETIAYADTGDDWDGEVAGVVKLKDGRYVAWESWWGPTGSGFSEDAYGGDADFTIAATLDEAVRFGLTDAGRARCGLASVVEKGDGE